MIGFYQNCAENFDAEIDKNSKSEIELGQNTDSAIAENEEESLGIPPDSLPACPPTPTGTTIIKIGSKDNYDGRDFNTVFNNPGSVFDSAAEAGQTKALEFMNTKYDKGMISTQPGTYGGHNKNDFAISRCPGDFSAQFVLSPRCLKLNKNTISLIYSTTETSECIIPLNTPMYLNIRGTAGIGTGFVIQNGIITYH